MILLHGTSGERDWVEGILQRGFSRRDVGRFVRLHLTDSMSVARYYAASAGFERGTRGVVLAVRVDPSDLRADLRAYAIAIATSDTPIRPPKAGNWKRSLKEMGAVVHTGEILPIDVEVVEFVRPARRKRIADPRTLVKSLALNGVSQGSR